MIKPIFNSIIKLGPYIYLWGPFVFFAGYFDGISFIQLPPIAILFCLLLMCIIVFPGAVIKHHTLTSSDYLIIAVASYFLLTTLLSDFPIISLKRWVLIIGLGSIFYGLGRTLSKPIQHIDKSIILYKSSICVLLIFSVIIYAFGSSYKELNLPRGEFIFMEAIPVFENTFIAQNYAGRFIGNFFFYRPSSLFPNPNGVAIFAMLVLAITIHKWDKRAFWLWLSLFVAITLLLWTASRAALIGSLIFFISYQFCMSKMYRRFVPLLFGTIICIPILFYIYTHFTPETDQWNNLYELFQLRERGTGWKLTLVNYTEGPWLTGSGFGIAQEITTLSNSSIFSVWIVLIIETGAIGMAILLLFLGSLFRYCFISIKTKQEDQPLLKANAFIFSLLLALLFHQSFDLSIFRFHPLNFIIFSLFGLSSNPMLRSNYTKL